MDLFIRVLSYPICFKLHSFLEYSYYLPGVSSFLFSFSYNNQFYKAQNKVEGDDPDVPTAWRHPRPDSKFYTQALMNWRRQSNISEK